MPVSREHLTEGRLVPALTRAIQPVFEQPLEHANAQMDPLVLISTVCGMLSLIHQVICGGTSEGDRDEFNAIRKDLRLIHFSEAGVLGLLRKMSNGLPVAENDWRTLTEFNDMEWKVEGAITHLGKASKSVGVKLPYEMQHHLELLAFGKVDLRRELQDTLNYLPRDNPVVMQQRASAWVAQIERLNREIEKLDSVLE